MKKLREHQKTCLKAIRGQTKLALFWRMRLGKTLVAIRWAKSFKPSSVLVICPPSVIETWEEHLEEEGIFYSVLSGPVPVRKMIAQSAQQEGVRWAITNYEGVVQRSDSRFPSPASFISELSWDVVILDESTAIRNPKAKRTKILCKHLVFVPCKAILSGLPNPENPILDYFEQYRFLYGSFLGHSNYWDFRRANFHERGYEWLPEMGTTKKVRKLIQETAQTLTRKQAGFFTPKVHESRYVDLPTECRREYDSTENQFAKLSGEETKYTVVKRTWMQRIAGGGYEENDETGSFPWWNHKIDELFSLLTGELRDSKVLVFFRFNYELQKARLRATSLGLHGVSITGKAPRAQRKRSRRLFQKDPLTRIAFVQTRVVQFGLDFSAADSVIFYSNWDEAEIRTQAEDRAISTSKKEPVLYIDLISRDTVDEDIHTALQEKRVNSIAFKVRLTELMGERMSR